MDLIRVLRALPAVERGRRAEDVGLLVQTLRERGSVSIARGPDRRRRLQKVIGRVDRLFPDGGNCLRRALLEISLDAGAAREPLNLGLRAHGGPRSGHAWLGTADAPHDAYDAYFAI